MASSKRTGIPYDLVDSDIVRLGTLLGLIRSLDALEGKTQEEKFSLLDLFINDSEPMRDYTKIPPYFSLAPTRIDENQRVSMHRKFVSSECSSYCGFVDEMLKQELTTINKHLCITLKEMTLESFVDAVRENANIVLETLLDEDDEELWNQLHILRNSLIGAMDICSYKDFALDQVKTLIRYKKPTDKILLNLSYLDANLSLFPGFEDIKCDTEEVRQCIHRSLVVRNHMKDPELKPFEMKAIIRECCIPALMFIDIKDVLINGIIGPYRNNPLCFANNGYYALKSVTEGVRLWLLDEGLTFFSERIRSELISYTDNLIKVYWAESHKKSIITDRLVKTITLLHRPNNFREIICSIVSTFSQWVPSELDAFDSFPSGHVIHLAHQIPLPDIVAVIN